MFIYPTDIFFNYFRSYKVLSNESDCVNSFISNNIYSKLGITKKIIIIIFCLQFCYRHSVACNNL